MQKKIKSKSKYTSSQKKMSAVVSRVRVWYIGVESTIAVQQSIRWLGCLSSWNNCSIKCGAVQHKGDHIVYYYDNVAMEVSAGKSDTYLISISHTTGALYYSCTVFPALCVGLCCKSTIRHRLTGFIHWSHFPLQKNHSNITTTISNLSCLQQKISEIDLDTGQFFLIIGKQALS